MSNNTIIFKHGHSSMECPYLKKDPKERLTPNGLSYDQEEKLFELKIQTLMKKYPEVQKVTVFWLCEFEKIMGALIKEEKKLKQNVTDTTEIPILE